MSRPTPRLNLNHASVKVQVRLKKIGRDLYLRRKSRNFANLADFAGLINADNLPNQRLITGSVKNAGMICISFPGMCGGTIVAVFDDVAEGQEVDP